MNKLNSLLIFGLFLGLTTQANCADRSLWEDWERASCCEKIQISIAMCTGSNFFLPGRFDITPEATPQGSPTAVTDPIFARREDGSRPFAKSVEALMNNKFKQTNKLPMDRRNDLLRPRYVTKE